MSVTQHEKAVRFRTLHDGPGPFVIPNPWDVGTARILAGLGFQALATSSAASAAALGRRDGALMRDEAMAHARLIVDATALPVSADLEKGFGDAPEVVARTIRLAADAGLVGCTIEDATGNPEAPLYDLPLAAERIAAAAQAARALPFPFVLVGIRGKSFSVAELAAAGVRRISLATSLYRAAMTGFLHAAREVSDAGRFGFLDRCVTTAELIKLMRS